MLKVLAGNLAATFNIDGGHLKRYLSRKAIIILSLCEHLVLHDQILIPTHDYLTAAGLIRLLGENCFNLLLDTGRLQFIRLEEVFGYIRGTGNDGSLVIIGDPQKRRPQDSPIENSVIAALSNIRGHYSDENQLSRLIVKNSINLKTKSIIEAVRKDAYADLEQTSLWKESYRFSNPNLLALPGMKQLQVRMIGPGLDVSRKPVDALLALALMNVELFLSEKFDCASVSTGSPIGDCIALKLSRFDRDHTARSQLWSFFEVAGVPDPTPILISDKHRMAEFIQYTNSSNAEAFRQWFHSNAALTENEILGAYIDLLHKLPWIQKAPAKVVRFAITTVAGLVPVLGSLASIVDTFVVDKFFSGRSPKFFIENLRKFSGQIKSRSL